MHILISAQERVINVHEIESGILAVPSDDMPVNIFILTNSEQLFLQPSWHSENSACTQKSLIPNRRDYYGSVYVILKNFLLHAISRINLKS